MGTLAALTWGCLPPAGERISLATRATDATFLKRCFDPYRPAFFGSGTAALAAAVRAAVTRADRPDPVVLLPAYTCPNVVSAVLHVGAQPRLVDLAFERPWMDRCALENSIDERVVALIAVDFLGIAERYEMLVPFAKKAGLVLIQDSAQAFPRARERPWRGDLVVLSFGRGKPVSLLGGGAVLCRAPALGKLLPSPVRGHGKDSVQFGLRARLYNLLRTPAVYRVPASLPLLNLGKTRFSPLDRITPAPPTRLQHLQANVEDYWRREETVQEEVAQILHDLHDEGVVNLPFACRATSVPRLLRYPLLFKDKMIRERLYAVLRQAGLGVSRMYDAALPGIEGLEKRFAGERYPNAEHLAGRLLTLPVHTGVTPDHLKRMRAHITQALRTAPSL